MSAERRKELQNQYNQLAMEAGDASYRVRVYKQVLEQKQEAMLKCNQELAALPADGVTAVNVPTEAPTTTEPEKGVTNENSTGA